MIKQIKSLLYFPIAYYFRFFAKIQLAIWKPTIILVTGSSGKTTLLHLIESQLQDKARYSHLANSSFGIPFDILGLKRKSLTPDEWLYLFLFAPFKAFKRPYKEKLYVVEADCDRPFEGKFLASLLQPNITLWTNVSRTHTVNFDYLVKNQDFKTVEQAIAHEFGYFLENTSDLAILNADDDLIKKESQRSKAKIKYISQKDLSDYKILKDHTEFKININDYSINLLLPKETSYSIQMTLALLDFLKIRPDFSFSKFTLPPGRCGLFKGIKNTIIIDSSYNATPDGVKSILGMFDQYPSDKKWLVLGDMIELGNEEKEEHERLGEFVSSMRLEKVILIGPRLLKYAYPRLTHGHPELVSGSRSSRIEMPKQVRHDTVQIIKFLMPKDALDYLMNNLKGGEVVLFKGARFLEGIIEHLLADKNDIKKLCRREKVWEKRRKQWGL